MPSSRLSLGQEAALIRLNKMPRKQGCIANYRTANALIRKGYIIELPKRGVVRRYELRQAGIRYNQTGKEIGE